MWGDQAAKVIGTFPALIWAMVVAYLIYILRGSLSPVVERLASVEAFGLKLSMSTKALDAAVEMGRKTTNPDLVVPDADRKRALARAQRERALLDGAEILWVDDRPSNNRNEARMLRGFGALITFACTTEEALDAIQRATQELMPFHVVLSDINRCPSATESDAGIRMLKLLREQNVLLPVIFYVGRLQLGSPIPQGAFGVTNRPDELLQNVLDVLARTRG